MLGLEGGVDKYTLQSVLLKLRYILKPLKLHVL